jgi:hypothetical protein
VTNITKIGAPSTIMSDERPSGIAIASQVPTSAAYFGHEATLHRRHPNSCLGLPRGAYFVLGGIGPRLGLICGGDHGSLLPPIPGQEVVQSGGGVIGDAREHVGEPARIVGVQFAGRDAGDISPLPAARCPLPVAAAV